MNLSMILVGFCLAVVTGAIAVATLARMKPHWTEQRRLLVASAILPTVTLIGVLLLILLIMSNSAASAEMTDLAAAAILTTGALFAAIALVGGFIGAALRQRGMRK